MDEAHYWFLHLRDAIIKQLDADCYEALNVINDSKANHETLYAQGFTPEQARDIIIANWSGPLYAFFRPDEPEAGTQLALF